MSKDDPHKYSDLPGGRDSSRSSENLNRVQTYCVNPTMHNIQPYQCLPGSVPKPQGALVSPAGQQIPQISSLGGTPVNLVPHEIQRNIPSQRILPRIGNHDSQNYKRSDCSSSSAQCKPVNYYQMGNNESNSRFVRVPYEYADSNTRIPYNQLHTQDVQGLSPGYIQQMEKVRQEYFYAKPQDNLREKCDITKGTPEQNPKGTQVHSASPQKYSKRQKQPSACVCVRQEVLPAPQAQIRQMPRAATENYGLSQQPDMLFYNSLTHELSQRPQQAPGHASPQLNYMQDPGSLQQDPTMQAYRRTRESCLPTCSCHYPLYQVVAPNSFHQGNNLYTVMGVPKIRQQAQNDQNNLMVPPVPPLQSISIPQVMNLNHPQSSPVTGLGYSMGQVVDNYVQCPPTGYPGYVLRQQSKGMEMPNFQFPRTSNFRPPLRTPAGWANKVNINEEARNKALAAKMSESAPRRTPTTYPKNEGNMQHFRDQLSLDPNIDMFKMQNFLGNHLVVPDKPQSPTSPNPQFPPMPTSPNKTLYPPDPTYDNRYYKRTRGQPQYDVKLEQPKGTEASSPGSEAASQRQRQSQNSSGFNSGVIPNNMGAWMPMSIKQPANTWSEEVEQPMPNQGPEVRPEISDNIIESTNRTTSSMKSADPADYVCMPQNLMWNAPYANYGMNDNMVYMPYMNFRGEPVQTGQHVYLPQHWPPQSLRNTPQTQYKNDLSENFNPQHGGLPLHQNLQYRPNVSYQDKKSPGIRERSPQIWQNTRKRSAATQKPSQKNATRKKTRNLTPPVGEYSLSNTLEQDASDILDCRLSAPQSKPEEASLESFTTDPSLSKLLKSNASSLNANSDGPISYMCSQTHVPSNPISDHCKPGKGSIVQDQIPSSRSEFLDQGLGLSAQGNYPRCDGVSPEPSSSMKSPGDGSNLLLQTRARKGSIHSRNSPRSFLFNREGLPGEKVHDKPLEKGLNSIEEDCFKSSCLDLLGGNQDNDNKLQNLLFEVNKGVQLDYDVEIHVLKFLDNFLLETAKGACMVAKYRGGTSLTPKDIQLELEQKWDIRIPASFKTFKPPKRNVSNAVHLSRLMSIQKRKLLDLQTKQKAPPIDEASQSGT